MILPDPAQGRKHPYVTQKNLVFLFHMKVGINKNKFWEDIVGALVSCLPETQQ